MNTQLEIGSIDRAHGLKGEVIVRLTSNVAERLDVGSELQAQDQLLVVKASRPKQDRFIVAFEGIKTRESAEALRGQKLFAPPLSSPPSNAYWAHELVGCELVDQNGSHCGKIVELVANPASDLLVLDGGDLVPANFIVSKESDKVFVDVPEGLLG